MLQQRQMQEERETTWQSRAATVEETRPLPSTTTLTWEELDALAHHVGVEPFRLRQAVANQTGLTTPPRIRMRQLQARERFLIGGVPLLYGLSIIAPLVITHRPDGMIVPLCFILPQILAFYLGILLRHPRKGALAGMLINACTIAAAIVTAKMLNGNVTPRAEDWQICAALLIGGVVAGVFGTVVRYGIDRWRSRAQGSSRTRRNPI